MKRYRLSKEKLNEIFKIHGFIQKPEGQLLYHLAKTSSEKGVVVELGSWKGQSTVCLGLGAKKRNIVYAIDTFTGDMSTGFENTFSQFKKNIHHFKLTNVIAIKKSTMQAIASWNKPISLLFIDASHTFKDTLKDFLEWEQFVLEGGLIVFHDTLLPNPPRKVFERHILPRNQFKIVDFVESIIVLQKVKKLNYFERVKNFFIYIFRDLRYALYINSWAIRKVASCFKIYHEKDL